MENLERNFCYRITFSFVNILAFEPDKLCPGCGFCFVFSTRGREFCNQKLSRGGDFDGKSYCPGVSLGASRGGGGRGAWGMVTSQIDTCITLTHVSHFSKFKSCLNSLYARNFEFTVSPLMILPIL